MKKELSIKKGKYTTLLFFTYFFFFYNQNIYSQNCECNFSVRYSLDNGLLKYLNEVCVALKYINDIKLIPCNNIYSFCSDYHSDEKSSYIDQKVIYYNLAYLDHFGSEINKRVVAIPILSHELYHLFRADPRKLSNASIEEKKQFELDADKFAGGMMRRLNISEVVLDQFIDKWKKISPDSIKKNDDYPAITVRADSLKAGYYDMVNFEITKFQIPPAITQEARKQLAKVEEITNNDSIKTINLRIQKLKELLSKFPECYLAYNSLGEYQLKLYKLQKQSILKNSVIQLNNSISSFSAALSYKFAYTQASYNLSTALIFSGLENKRRKDFENAFLEASKALLYSPQDDLNNLKFLLNMAKSLNYLNKRKDCQLILAGIENQLKITSECNSDDLECLNQRIESLIIKLADIH